MEKAFPIDFVRQVIQQTLFEEHSDNPNEYFGGDNQVNLFSFYEQLQKDDEVNRYVEIYRDLVEQQNRTGLIMNGTLIAPENPTITNINSATIIPMTFTCSFRVKLENRDMAINTINHLIELLKGRKHDVAMLEDGTLLKVGTLGNNVLGEPLIKKRDYIGGWNWMAHPLGGNSVDTKIPYLIGKLEEQGFVNEMTYPQYLYYSYAASGGASKRKMHLAVKKTENSDWETVEDDDINGIIVPKEQTFKKFKLSMSFDSIRCDEPRNLNADEFCVISFGGSATLVNDSVKLGNELTKLSISKTKIMAKEPIVMDENETWLEPLEIPSGNNANTQALQLLNNNFKQNSHTDGLTITLQYTFIYDESITLLNEFFEYGRYGIQANTENSYEHGISPNMIFTIKEIWSSWGNVKVYEYLGKIVSSVDIENTESDTLTITVPIQVQGENN